MKLLRTILVALFLCFTFGGTACAVPLTCTVTGTVYKTDGVTPYAGGYITFRPTTTQTFTPDTVAIPSIRVTLDTNGAIPAGTTLVQGERLLVSVGNDTARAITVPSGASCPVLFSDLYGAVQVPPPAGIVHSVTVSATGDTGLSVSPTTGDVVITFGPALDGVHTNGSDVISDFSVNGALNPATYGVISGSNTTGTGTINSASNSLSLTATGDWTNGEGIAIPLAGANTALSAPAQPTVVATCPSGACATAHTYQVRAFDMLCGSPAESVASVAVNNNVTLDATHFNTVTITPVAAVETYAVYDGTRLAGLVINSIGAGGNQVFKDIGATVTAGSPCIPSAPTGAARPQALYTTITSGGGTTTLVLAASASNTATSQTVYHDDAAAIQTAISNFSNSTGGTIQFPANKQFTISRPITIGSSGSTTMVAPTLLGTGGAPPHLKATAIMQGLPILKITNAFKPRVADLVMVGTSNAVPIAGVQLHIDNPGASSVSGAYVGEALIDGISMDTTSPTNCVAITAAPTYDQNNSEHTIRHLTCNAPHAGVYIGMLNALGEYIDGGDIEGSHAAILLNGGSFDLVGTVLSTSTTGWILDLEAGTYNHHISMANPVFNAGGGLLYITPTGISNGIKGILITGADSDAGFSGNSDGYMVESTGTTQRMGLSISASNIGQDGIPNNKWAFSAAVGRNVFLNGNFLSVTSFEGNANFRAVDNRFASTCPTSTITGTWYGAGNVGNGGTSCTGFLNNLQLTGIVEQCTDDGTVAINTSFDFTTGACQKITTSTTGLTYTLSTTGVPTDQVVTIESYITGAIAAGPLWATSSGAIKWTGGVAPVSSNANGLTDIIRLKWDGTNWQEISRAMGNH